MKKKMYNTRLNFHVLHNFKNIFDFDRIFFVVLWKYSNLVFFYNMIQNGSIATVHFFFTVKHICELQYLIQNFFFCLFKIYNFDLVKSLIKYIHVQNIYLYKYKIAMWTAYLNLLSWPRNSNQYNKKQWISFIESKFNTHIHSYSRKTKNKTVYCHFDFVRGHQSHNFANISPFLHKHIKLVHQITIYIGVFFCPAPIYLIDEFEQPIAFFKITYNLFI